ncbi:hypothetical protein [Nocardia mangyaensis]|uniref:hypothetical protein n=1 Tax=Nocardia mangyaensis TaxID=2213200 RepID=UPI002674EBD4|nr:hypothetical protein [Nocardia mangyaensis]MDO3645664.1 hypothetical protein [Nocardia mangyaensis]
MSKTGRPNHRRADRETKWHNASARTERTITVRSEKRIPPDLRKLSRAVIAIALADMNAAKSTENAPVDDGDANEPREGGRL